MKLLPLVVILSLAFLAVESSVHSVHHLNRGDDEHSCSVLATSQHVHGTVSDIGVALAAPTVIREETVGEVAFEVPDRFFRPDVGRAPPLAPSV